MSTWKLDGIMQIPVGQRLVFMGGLVLAYSTMEMLVGFAMNSVTLISDGFHNLADAGGFAIAIFANFAQTAAKDESRAARIGLIGGLTNCSITLILTFCAGVEAFSRLYFPPHIYEVAHIGPLYFLCAVLGIVINGLGTLVLSDHGHSHGGVACTHSSHSAAPQPSLTQLEASGGTETKKLLGDTNGHAHAHGHGHSHDHCNSHSHGPPHAGCTDGGFQEEDRMGRAGAGGGHAGHVGHGHGGKMDANVHAMWLHTMQDMLGSLIVLICGLVQLHSEWTWAKKADAVGGLIVCALVWATTVPVWWQCANGLASSRHR